MVLFHNQFTWFSIRIQYPSYSVGVIKIIESSQFYEIHHFLDYKFRQWPLFYTNRWLKVFPFLFALFRLLTNDFYLFGFSSEIYSYLLTFKAIAIERQSTNSHVCMCVCECMSPFWLFYPFAQTKTICLIKFVVGIHSFLSFVSFFLGFWDNGRHFIITQCWHFLSTSICWFRIFVGLEYSPIKSQIGNIFTKAVDG